ncbi:YafY family protein [Acidovorax sp. MR-S7]|uniref:helix-turn-helix transcriptional regulator n=1 Tax=Acidovorax sp. MR-S7 TaxID=1268622 RepID=UPI00037B22D2|nr:WYL domain-containing protein [Acidovorax sp. MR-S7]
MPARPAAQESLHIALEILKRIPRHGKTTARELHAQLAAMGLERSLRRIQSLLKFLCQHYDIECDDSSKPHGFCWKPQAGLAAHSLNPSESLLLAMAGQQMKYLLPVRMRRSLVGLFDAAEDRLRRWPEETRQARSWLGKTRTISTSQPLLPPDIDEAVFQAVGDALYADHWLDIDYSNVAGKRSRKRVMPLGLVQQGVRMFLVARFEGHADARTLTLHRFHSATDTGLPFTRPADFDLERFDTEGQFGFVRGNRIDLVFRIRRIAGQHLLETPLSLSQKHEPCEGGDWLRIRAQVVRTLQLEQWLRGFGRMVVVEEPPEMVDAVSDSAN